MAVDKPNETPKEKFVRLANARSGAASKQLKLLRNLAAYAYEIDGTLAKEIVSKLEREMQELKAKWRLVEGTDVKRRKKSDSEDSEESESDDVPAATTSSPADVLKSLSE